MIERGKHDNPKVLIVDDEVEVLNSLADLLRKNFHIFATVDVGEALNLLITKDFSLVISDQRMPELTGTEFLARAAKSNPDTPRILLTGYSDIEAVSDAVNRARISQYITKPWDAIKLPEMLLPIAQRHQLLLENRRLMAQLAKLTGSAKDSASRIEHLENSVSSMLHYNQVLQAIYDQDIAERKRTEKKIKENLLEKEILLREIHHRVKNNMAVMSSLLSLQASGIKDDSMKELFNESRQRIKAMALVHEKLYRTENLTRIDFHDYITSIAGELVSAYHRGERSIITKIDAPNIFFDIDTALPCGLIINELITNSLNHGFTEKLSGELYIDLKKVNTTYTLIVSDNGIGLKEDFDPAKAESMGMQLVTVLVRQLRGTLDFQANVAKGKGTKVIITFNEKGRKQP